MLLVEDNALVRMANAAVLAEAGMVVTEVGSGEEPLGPAGGEQQSEHPGR
ncbi:hypothetical protein FH063_002175 [Azospirillum argentinense]|uniref:Response regulatory domain-containing protein n=1 Tax=Azospirillum argentinense TaxID=2970906 RepID=A0A5B0KQQ7_9PROT|nr:hypothetical protein FH063_002175 [Azospirillum argentinense]